MGQVSRAGACLIAASALWLGCRSEQAALRPPGETSTSSPQAEVIVTAEPTLQATTTAATAAATPTADAATAPAAPALPAEDEQSAYLVAKAASAAGQHAGAAASYARVRQAGGLLAPLATLRHAQALAAARRHGEALDAFVAAADNAKLPDALRTIASTDGAKAAERAGRPDVAIALLSRVGRDWEAPSSDIASARWRTAELMRAQGDASWTQPAFAAIGAAPSASAALAALNALDAARVPVPAGAAAFVRYRHRENSQAATLYRAVLGGSPAAAQAADAWFYLGALAERADDNAGALSAYANSLQLAPNGPLADDSRWWRGNVLEAADERTAAIAEYDLLATVFPDSQFTGDARLRAALAASHLGRAPEAASRLRDIIATRAPSEGALAARWLTLLGLRTGNDPTARSLDPTSLAALLEGTGERTFALTRGSTGDWDRAPAPWEEADAWMRQRHGEPPTDSLATLDPAALHAAKAFAAVGELDALRPLLQSLVNVSRNQPHQTLALARLASDLGSHDVALIAASRVLVSLGPRERLQAPRAITRLLYPAPYADAVASASQAEGVPPLLLLALVRQESAFHPGAVSPANAFGLTQVIAPTGRQIATALQQEWRQERLFDPAVSLRYGAFYLGDQLRRFDGNVLATLAAYNAGPGSAERWLRTQQVPGPEGYIETIDYSETRLYLKRVLEAYGWYRYLYGGASEPSLG